MVDDPIRQIWDALERRQTEPELVRRPDSNHPFQAAAVRAPRRRTYADPTGQQAIGNIKKETKK